MATIRYSLTCTHTQRADTLVEYTYEQVNQSYLKRSGALFIFTNIFSFLFCHFLFDCEHSALESMLRYMSIKNYKYLQLIKSVLVGDSHIVDDKLARVICVIMSPKFFVSLRTMEYIWINTRTWIEWAAQASVCTLLPLVNDCDVVVIHVWCVVPLCVSFKFSCIHKCTSKHRITEFTLFIFDVLYNKS